ncbi:oligosaccharide flippase family protein [Dyella humicola]|uniref:oligosaccharide flippase family protein n=1 Tax=Dyella humicola TaxID=2992126 RepID=UPI0022565053|nr:oligosaccharide flippase family protein [Dyella humicola]
MNQRLAVLRSVAIVSVSAYIEYGLGLLISVWVARALGPADFGRYAFTVWLCRWLIICSNHALTTSSMKFIAEADGAGREDIASHVASGLNRVQHVSLCLVLVAFALISFIVKPVEWRVFLGPMIVLSIVAVSARANYAMRVAISKGQEHFEPEAIATVLSGVLTVALVIAATVVHADLLAFIAIYAVSSLSLNLINRIAYRRYCLPIVPGPIPAEMSVRLRRHLWLTATLVMLTSIKGGTIEMFMLNTFSTTTAVGFFAIASTLTRGAVELFSVGLTATLLPYMAKAFGQKGQEYAARFLSEATRFYWAAGLAIAGLGLVTTSGLVTLMYGHKYTEAIPSIITILVLAGALLFVNGIVAFQAVVDRQDDRIRLSGGALIVNIVLGIVLIPRFGLAGAVLAYSGTRISELILAVYYLRRVTSEGIPWSPMLRLLAVGALATAVAMLVLELVPGRFAFVPAGIAFICLYAPAGVLVRYWTEEDYALLGTIAGRLGLPGRMFMRGLQLLRVRVTA